MVRLFLPLIALAVLVGCANTQTRTPMPEPTAHLAGAQRLDGQEQLSLDSADMSAGTVNVWLDWTDLSPGDRQVLWRLTSGKDHIELALEGAKTQFLVVRFHDGSDRRDYRFTFLVNDEAQNGSLHIEPGSHQLTVAWDVNRVTEFVLLAVDGEMIPLMQGPWMIPEFTTDSPLLATDPSLAGTVKTLEFSPEVQLGGYRTDAAARVIPDQVQARSLGDRPPVAFGHGALSLDDSYFLSNEQVLLAVTDSAGLPAMWTADGRKILVNDELGEPLWTARCLPPGSLRPITVSALAAPPAISMDTDSLTLLWQDLPLETGTLTVRLTASLAPDDTRVRWRAQAETDGVGLWDLRVPNLAWKLPGKADDTTLAMPYRRGVELPFGIDWERPYPGSSCRWQMMAGYDRQLGHGFYIAAEDDEGWSKDIAVHSRKADGAAVFSFRLFPGERLRPGNTLETAYDMVAGPYSGSWWEATQLYRQWWVTSRYASRGPTLQRDDVPDHVKNAAAVLRLSGSNPERTVENNRRTAIAMSEYLDGRPIFGTYYRWEGRAVSIGVGDHGLILPPKDGVRELLSDLRARQVYINAYRNSMIGDQEGFSPDDLPRARAAVTESANHYPVVYTPWNLPEWAMCRGTPWWRDNWQRASRFCVEDVGFSGMYLDSFGKESYDCFATTHYHPPGDGRLSVNGQRALAQTVRQAIRRGGRDHTLMGGEASTEAFVDLVDYSLYALNTYTGYIPMQRAIFGDYMVGHARTIRPVDGGDLYHELATLFVEGTIFGRFFCSGGSIFLLEPEHSELAAYTKRLIEMNDHAMPWIRHGQLLAPLPLDVPTISYQDACLSRAVRDAPAIRSSVTRATDGSVAITITNPGEADATLSVPIDPAWRANAPPLATLTRLHPDGNSTPIASADGAWTQTVTIPARDVLVMILR